MKISATIRTPVCRRGVYILKRGARIIYIGRSSDVLARMSGHKDKRFDVIEIIWTRADAKREAKLIRQHQPDLNKNSKCEALAGKQIRISDQNEKVLTEIIKGTGISLSKAANIAIRQGVPKVRRKYVKNGGVK